MRVGRGIYKDPKAPAVEENSVTVDVVTSGAQSCLVAHNKLRHLAAVAAHTARQSAVLAVTHCAEGKIEAEFVSPDGRPAFQIPGFRAWRDGERDYDARRWDLED